MMLLHSFFNFKTYLSSIFFFMFGHIFVTKVHLFRIDLLVCSYAIFQILVLSYAHIYTYLLLCRTIYNKRTTEIVQDQNKNVV